MSAADLILTDKEGEDQADDMLAALSEIAYATPQHREAAPKKKRFKSRFFFVLSASIVDEAKSRAHKVKPKQVEYVDAEIDTRVKTLRKDMPKDLEARIETVREFFLREIGPRTLAGGAGSVQARSVVEKLLNTQVDGTQFAKFERMSHEAVNIRMAKFIAKFYGLPRRDVARLLTSIEARPQQPIMIPIPNGAPSDNRRPKKDKKANTA